MISLGKRLMLLVVFPLLGLGLGVAEEKTELPRNVNLEPGPVAQFEKSCARCHGPEGAFFGGQFRHTAEEEDLLEVTAAMMRGPAMLKPMEHQFRAMAAYMRSLQRNAPYATINNGQAFASGESSAISGEKRAGTTVELLAGGQSLPVTQQDRTWSATPGARSFTIMARADDRVTSFTFPERQWPAVLAVDSTESTR